MDIYLKDIGFRQIDFDFYPCYKPFKACLNSNLSYVSKFLIYIYNEWHFLLKKIAMENAKIDI